MKMPVLLELLSAMTIVRVSHRQELSGSDPGVTMFDWETATHVLHHISKNQVVRFLGGSDEDDIYGFGFFCDASTGVIYLTANTEQYHETGFSEFEKRYGPTDKEVYRWDIGNWKYPGGLFTSSSPEQLDFDRTWRQYQEALSQLEDESKQLFLEEVCLKVLERLVDEGVFSREPALQGFMILGPNDQGEALLAKKRRFNRQKRKMWGLGELE